MKHSPSCPLYNVYRFRVYLINWSAVITEQCKKKIIISSPIEAMAYLNHNSPHTVCFQLNTRCNILLHFSLHSLLPAQYELWHSQVQLLTYSAFNSIQDVVYLTTVLHILSTSTFPYTIQATFVCSSHTSASFMFIKDKFFSKLCNSHSKNLSTLLTNEKMHYSKYHSMSENLKFQNTSMVHLTIWASTGNMILATAVLDDTSVRKVVAVATVMRIKEGGSTWRYTNSLPT